MPDDACGSDSLLRCWPLVKSSLIYLTHFPEAAKIDHMDDSWFLAGEEITVPGKVK